MTEDPSFYQAQAEFTALQKASRAVLAHREFPEAARVIFEACKEITGATAGYIALIEDNKNILTFLDSGGSPCSVDSSLPMPVRGLRSEVLRAGKTVYENNFPDSQWIHFLPEGHIFLENALFAPLEVEGSPVGFLGLANKTGGFTASDARLASAFAEMAAIALVNSRAEQALREARSQLETQVQERTRQLDQAIKELKSELADRRKIETRLRLQTTALESSISGIIITDLEGNIHWSNPSFSRISGYTSEEALGMNTRELKSGLQDPSFYEKMWVTILSGKFWQGELANRRKDGRIYYVEETITPVLDEDGTISRFVAISKDITQQKKVQQELQQSEKLLRSIIEIMPVGVWILDKSGQIMLANQESHKIWAGAHYVGMDDYNEYKAWSAESGKRLEPKEWAAVKALGKGEPSLNQELEIQDFEGNHKFILNSAVPYLDDKGKVLGAIVINQDISGHKRSEKMLQLERAKLKNILDSMTDGIYIVDQDHNIDYANPVILRDFGPLGQQKCYEYFHGRTETCPWCVNELVLTGETINQEMSSSKTGKVYDLYDTPLRDPDGKIYKLKQIHDITLRKLTETQLEETNQYLLTLSQSERSQRQLSETLAATSLALSQTLNLDTVANTLLDHLEQLVPIEQAWVWVLEEAERLTLKASRGVEKEPGNNSHGLHLVRQPLFHEIITQQKSQTSTALVNLPGMKNHPETGEFIPWLGVPIVAGGKSLGLCMLSSSLQDAYSSSQVRMVEAMVSQAAVAIQNARLYHAEMRARQTAEILRQASLAISRSLEMDAVLAQVLENLTSLIPYDAAVVALQDSESNFVVHSARGDMHFRPGDKDLLEYLNHGVLTKTMVTKAEGLLINDIHASYNIQTCPFSKCMRSWILMPLKVGEQVYGFYLLQKEEPDYFTQDHFHLVEALVSQAAVAGQNAWLFDQVRYGHERLMDLSRRMVTMQEHERSYIARELHDESGQALASLLLGLDLLERSAQEPQKVIEGVARLEEIVSGVMENLHRIAMNLRPASLDHLGLANALQQYVQNFSEEHSIEVHFDAPNIDERLPSEVEVAFYRITQEAFTNVIRHAQATRIQLRLEIAGDQLNLTIEDNGVGFDPIAKVERNKLGLIGMRERAGMLGGQLIVESGSGQGTILRVEIPWTKPVYSH